MNNYFKEQYQHYSTADLLKITLQPQSYQKAAVIAATDVLQNRSVTEAEREEAEKQCKDEVNKAPQSGQLIHAIKGFYSMPYRWVNVILTISVLQYLQVLYNDVSVLDNVIHNQNFRFRSVFIGSYFDLLLLPIAFYLFYKRRRWGWIFIFVANSFTILPTLAYFFLYYIHVADSAFPFFLFKTLLSTIFVFALWKPETRLLYNIDNKTGLLTVFVTVIMLVCCLFMF